MIPCTLLSSPISHPQINPNPRLSPPQPPARSRRRLRCRCRRSGDSRWDSNAESFRFRFRDEERDGESRNGADRARRWWSDEPADEFDDEFDPFDEDSENIWDKIWIFKVFKAYGYLLPAIIASFLLATGPKAFLMALALPLGQSAISLAIEKLWGRVSQGPQPRPKAKRKPFARSSSNFRKEEKEGRGNDGKERDSYQSWVSADSRAPDRMSNSKKSSFGGWDELDDQKGPIGSRSPTTGVSSEADRVKGKLSKRGRYRDAPLFLRLLIAVFPFLGSWTRIL